MTAYYNISQCYLKAKLPFLWLCLATSRAGTLPASYLATSNGRPTYPYKPQAHVGRASCPPHPQRPRMVALHKNKNPPEPNHWLRGVLLN